MAPRTHYNSIMESGDVLTVLLGIIVPSMNASVGRKKNVHTCGPPVIIGLTDSIVADEQSKAVLLQSTNALMRIP